MRYKPVYKTLLTIKKKNKIIQHLMPIDIKFVAFTTTTRIKNIHQAYGVHFIYDMI